MTSKIPIVGVGPDGLAGLTEAEVVVGARRSSMDELAEVTMAADKVLVF